MKAYPFVSSLLLLVALTQASHDHDGVNTPSQSQYVRNHHRALLSSENGSILKSDPKIIGGTDVEDGRYGFFVQGEGCGGSLVAADVVLSAAHCQYSFEDISSVYVGNFERDQLTDGAEHLAITSGMHVHPDYDYNTNENDLMLFKIEPSTLTPIALNSNPRKPRNNQELTAIGFGVTEYEYFPSTLQSVIVNYVTNPRCTVLLAEEEFSYIDASMLCAMQENKDTCQGDSGGPLFAKVSGVVTLMGVTSWGNGCAQPDSPGVYARISHNIEWIQETICNLTDTSPDFCGDDDDDNEDDC